jgi:hypothetical protein
MDIYCLYCAVLSGRRASVDAYFGLEVMPVMTNTLDELLVLCTVIYPDCLVICGHLSI